MANSQSTTQHDFGSGPVPAHRHSNGGGWVADTASVADTAYVGPDARVFGKAQVYGEAKVYDEAQVSGEARVYGEAKVYDEARVSGKARVYDKAVVSDTALISDGAWVYGDAKVYDKAEVWGEARVHGNAWVYGEARVHGNAWVYGEARVRDKALVYGTAWICDGALVYGNALVSGDALVCDKARVSGDATVSDKAWVRGDATVCGEAMIIEKARVCGKALVCGDAILSGEEKVDGKTKVYTETLIDGTVARRRTVDGTIILPASAGVDSLLFKIARGEAELRHRERLSEETAESATRRRGQFTVEGTVKMSTAAAAELSQLMSDAAKSPDMVYTDTIDGVALRPAVDDAWHNPDGASKEAAASAPGHKDDTGKARAHTVMRRFNRYMQEDCEGCDANPAWIDQYFKTPDNWRAIADACYLECPLSDIVDVGDFGARKYCDDGWLSVPNGVDRYQQAFARHAVAVLDGQDNCPDSGLPHAAHAAWNAIAVWTLQRKA